jgi:hypothetical protein
MMEMPPSSVKNKRPLKHYSFSNNFFDFCKGLKETLSPLPYLLNRLTGGYLEIDLKIYPIDLLPENYLIESLILKPAELRSLKVSYVGFIPVAHAIFLGDGEKEREHSEIFKKFGDSIKDAEREYRHALRKYRAQGRCDPPSRQLTLQEIREEGLVKEFLRDYCSTLDRKVQEGTLGRIRFSNP